MSLTKTSDFKALVYLEHYPEVECLETVIAIATGVC